MKNISKSNKTKFKFIFGITFLVIVFFGFVMFSQFYYGVSPVQNEESSIKTNIVTASGKNSSWWHENLTPEQKRILINKGTEIPFTGKLLNEKRVGTYFAAGSMTPVFRSEDKYDSGTGWPSFTKPLDDENIILKEDTSLGMKRVEVLSKEGEHLGHVFDDGPKESTGKRFCLNSAALVFIADEDLDKNTLEKIKMELQAGSDVEKSEQSQAVFAGGCFWCMEAAFEGTKGVLDVVSGYTGGTTKNPTYEEVSSGKTGHYEAIKVTYDKNNISYKELADYFLRNIDPTDEKGQFVDKGAQYGTAIFYANDKEKKDAEQSIKELADSGRFDKPIVTKVLPAKEFYMAEEYHQDYYKKRTLNYQLYAAGTGRKEFLKKKWD